MLLLTAGCSLIPDVSHQPVVHNPFPQLARVAVVPFFNLTSEPSVDGRQFALAYFFELQQVQGFQVVPVGSVEQAIKDLNLTLDKPENVQKLAQMLDVDAVVIGTVTDYHAYYPPRCAMHVEWYAANPCYHPIPAGYGLPWGTTDEEEIPAPLVFEAEMALARAQLKTQTPPYSRMMAPPPVESPQSPRGEDEADEMFGDDLPDEQAMPEDESPARDERGDESHESEARRRRWLAKAVRATHAANSGENATAGGTIGATVPDGLPDGRAFIPPGPCAENAVCHPPKKVEPVLQHTKAYNALDSEFTEALASHYHFNDDARFGGWQAYMQRSEDFIRFCCRLHIHEMLSARGGAGETRVVWRWSDDR